MVQCFPATGLLNISTWVITDEEMTAQHLAANDIAAAHTKPVLPGEVAGGVSLDEFWINKPHRHWV